MISIIDLYKSFGKQVVLNKVSMELLPGEIYGFVGRNGAGKTTFFNCIAGLEKFQGEIKYTKGLLKNVLGLLPTDPYFFPKITGLEYLEMMCISRDIDFKQKKDYLNVFELPLNKYISEYSTGMQKKIAILGVLMQQNEVFIFDEPFNGLDIQSNLTLSEIILQLKNQGKIILLSSHIFSTLEELCDEVFLLEKWKFLHFENKGDFEAIKNKMPECF